MPFRKVNANKLQKLKLEWPKVKKDFGKMTNLDSKGGGLVREFQGIAIKRCHSGTADRVINTIQSKVSLHNQTRQAGGYKLLFPWAHKLDRNHIAMARVRAPTVADILEFRTEEGTRFFERMKRVHKVDEAQLRRAYERVHQNSRDFFFMSDLFLVGYKKGEFLFLPTMDLH